MFIKVMEDVMEDVMGVYSRVQITERLRGFVIPNGAYLQLTHRSQKVPSRK